MEENEALESPGSSSVLNGPYYKVGKTICSLFVFLSLSLIVVEFCKDGCPDNRLPKIMSAGERVKSKGGGEYLVICTQKGYGFENSGYESLPPSPPCSTLKPGQSISTSQSGSVYTTPEPVAVIVNRFFFFLGKMSLEQ